MILEELVGSFVSLFSSLIIRLPPLSRETAAVETDNGSVIFEENPEGDEVFEGLIHREYQQDARSGLPYYEDEIPVTVRAHEQRQQPRRRFCKSFLRSFKANIGLLLASVFVLGLLIAAVVYLDMNTSDACIEWMHHNFKVPSHVQNLQMVGMAFSVFAVMSWFPGYIAMLWGFKEFKNNYLWFLFVIQLVTGAITLVYKIVMFDKMATSNDSKYILPNVILFIFSFILGAYLVARKFKKVNPATPHSLLRIFFILSFSFLSVCLLSYIFIFIIIKNFKATEDRIRKAIIAALTPGMTIPFTAVAKYLVLRKSSQFITPGRGFVLCYFLRGGSILLYRTMQAGFQDIWVFIGLSLLHGVSNVLSKATLNIRIQIWRYLLKSFNRTCCGPRLQVRSLNSPNTRRLNADLEIQNILFEYTTVIFSQTYLACYLVMSFDVPPWHVIQGSLVRVAISFAIDFVFNIISVFIQIHYYDIPMQKVWQKCWRLHVIANAFMIIISVSYFATALLKVFANNTYTFKEEYVLRNCTTAF